ncbi:MAG: OadG family protein [Breznakibacter sp.]|nr:OadG family protein [Breznakibacter sp.]
MLLCAALSVRAQSSIDLRINEVLVVNDSNYVDGFGQHSPWVEIFNTAYNSVDIGGLYLTDDLNNPTKYRIPKGQTSTIIPTRGYIVFFGDNNPTNGILHLNFDFRESSMIALFEGNGKTLIDSVHLSKNQKSDISWGRSINGTGDWVSFENTTPNASNEPDQVLTAADRFGVIDPSGSGLTFISMGVVFSALILLSIVFTMIGKLMSGAFFKKKSTAGQETSAKSSDAELSGEMAAAIMMALHLYRKEQQDDNHAVLTINRMSKIYSPWSSKIYSMRRMPR